MTIHLINANSEYIPLGDKFVHVAVTSPPYYGQRDYGTGVWQGGDPDCDHKPGNRNRVGKSSLDGGTKTQGHQQEGFSRTCKKCGAHWVDLQIGTEETPESYLQRMLDVFREVKRVLRNDGVLWVNMGDAYAGSGIGANPNGKQGTNKGTLFDPANSKDVPLSYKPKDLMNMPMRLLSALQADGWYHRSTVIWVKTNPMPESVAGTRWERHKTRMGKIAGSSRKQDSNPAAFDVMSGGRGETTEMIDCPGCKKCNPHNGLVLRRGAWRPTTSHEYIFMFSKSKIYWSDGEPVREQSTGNAHAKGKGSGKKISDPGSGIKANSSFMESIRNETSDDLCATRNARTVWEFTTQSYQGAHFATYPEELPRRCLKATISEKGCCPTCGAQWARIIEKGDPHLWAWSTKGPGNYQIESGTRAQITKESTLKHTREHYTMGWLPTCDCPDHAPVPAVVLDPFAGSGTTGVVARELGAHFIGLDFSFDYLYNQARKRLELDKLEAWENGKAITVTEINDLPLFSAQEV